MAAGDLNLLKSWNPKLMKNRKKVWQTEQDLLTEEQKFKERQKELDKEHDLQNLLSSSKDNQLKQKKLSGLEWMYDERMNKDENEEYLLGQKKLDIKVINKDNKEIESTIIEEQKIKKLKFDYSNDDPMSKFNKVSKIHKKKNKISKKPSSTNKQKQKFSKNSFDY
ncbi:similar to Saccharomyces cerevisiae YNL245C CWC25 Splicing factor required for the first step of pre-mRNA splicing [Maudiozyma saulgeensis]|uniref:Pre-mRNA-splicing factor CWC25 n=1 Tax=Maudiozyma saulgeensis TaxID=1789683 RepID=A0A1X7R2D6_9SACH|nr:similar to Saccharomyces cerevisiae YNL245C CWC25 Splicing factor required for the first step of pre-mRNA splicing [Kazachstania saulgeensis]